jgi:hypothetical protein
MTWCFDDEATPNTDAVSSSQPMMPLACLDGKLKTATAAAGVELFLRSHLPQTGKGLM